ncbi:MAG: hypothetical protein FJW81_10820 [Actinobacteria bacterium]|nr:hypothetical protein [Actinomycetota bacterium]
MRIVRLALCALALGLVVAAPAAARELSVAAPGQGGNDRTCDPCRTIQGALMKAESLPGVSVISLAAGEYREDLLIDDPFTVSILGTGPGTLLRGRLTVAVPPGERLPGGSVRVYEYDPRRIVFLSDLALRPDGLVQIRDANLSLTDVDVNGRIRGERSALTLVTSQVGGRDADPCGSAVRLNGAPVSGWLSDWPQRYGAGTISNSIVSGGRGITVVEADLLVGDSLVNADATGCAGDAVRVIGGSIAIEDSVLSRSADGVLGAPGRGVGGAAVYGDNATVFLTRTTIGGPFREGVWMAPCFLAQDGCGGLYDLRGVAVVGAQHALKVDSDRIHETGRAWIVGTGTYLHCPERAPCTEVAGVELDRAGRPTGNVFGQLLEDPTGGPETGWYPKATGILIDAVTDNWGWTEATGFRYVGPDQGVTDPYGRPRPVPILPGRPARYDIGAYEHPTLDGAPPGLLADLGIGPDWADVQVAAGGIVGGVIGGLGVPVRPGVANAPEAGAAAAADAGGGAAAAPAVQVAAAGPRIEIVLPLRARQGDVVRVRVKVPWQGRLAVRVYGAKGGLINVGRGRKVNRGWRVVKVRLGPNARVGPMRVLASHQRAGKDTLSATATSAVVKRPRG